MKDEITITVSGSVGTGKTTILTEIAIALKKAGIRTLVRTEEDEVNSRYSNDSLQGRCLDVLAKRERKGKLEVKLIELTTSKLLTMDDILDDQDIPF